MTYQGSATKTVFLSLLGFGYLPNLMLNILRTSNILQRRLRDDYIPDEKGLQGWKVSGVSETLSCERQRQRTPLMAVKTRKIQTSNYAQNYCKHDSINGTASLRK